MKALALVLVSLLLELIPPAIRKLESFCFPLIKDKLSFFFGKKEEEM